MRRPPRALRPQSLRAFVRARPAPGHRFRLPMRAYPAILARMSDAHPGFLRYRHDLVPRARQLREEQTDQERRLWYGHLRKAPLRFQRQKPIGTYIVDFYCHAARLVVEIDGWRHFTESGRDHDENRTRFLESQGLLVLRYRGEAVDADMGAVAAQIVQIALERAAAR